MVSSIRRWYVWIACSRSSKIHESTRNTRFQPSPVCYHKFICCNCLLAIGRALPKHSIYRQNNRKYRDMCVSLSLCNRHLERSTTPFQARSELTSFCFDRNKNQPTLLTSLDVHKELIMYQLLRFLKADPSNLDLHYLI